MNPPKSEKIHLEVCQGRQGQGFLKYLILIVAFVYFTLIYAKWAY